LPILTATRWHSQRRRRPPRRDDQGHDLAQANLSRLRYPPDAPEAAEFIAALDRVNWLAERSRGFVWRHRADSGHISLADTTGDPLLIINLSVWRSYQSLHWFIYRSAHGHYVRRRREWFDSIIQPSTVLWWLPAGSYPTPSEALAHLEFLRRYGPTSRAFSSRTRFDPDGRRETSRRSKRSAGCDRDQVHNDADSDASSWPPSLYRASRSGSAKRAKAARLAVDSPRDCRHCHSRRMDEAKPISSMRSKVLSA